MIITFTSYFSYIYVRISSFALQNVRRRMPYKECVLDKLYVHFPHISSLRVCIKTCAEVTYSKLKSVQD